MKSDMSKTEGELEHGQLTSNLVQNECTELSIMYIGCLHFISVRSFLLNINITESAYTVNSNKCLPLYSFFPSFHKYLLKASYLPDPSLGIRDAAANTDR